MARGSKNGYRSEDTTDISSEVSSLLRVPGPRPSLSVSLPTPVTDAVLTSIEDRRLWSPYEAPAMTTSAIPATIVGDPTYPPSYSPETFPGRTGEGGRSQGVTNPPPWRPPPQFGFERPSQNVLICMRRKSRREVLFARGKSGGGKRRPRRTQFSEVKCSR